MTLFYLAFIWAATLAATPSIDLFLYWQSQAKGEQLFTWEKNTSEENLPLLPRIRKRLEQKGVKIQSWEIGKHRKSLLSWAAVKDMSDVWAWLFPKKPDLEQTKWIFWSLGPEVQTFDFKRLPKEHLVLYLYEPPTVEPKGYDPEFQKSFSRIFTWDDDLVDGKKFFKFYYPELKQVCVENIPFEEKKFCTMVATRLGSKHPLELYKEREKVIRFFENKEEGMFDLYGRNWEKKKFKNYKGPIPNKLETIKKYKFSICYENMKDIKGYITEKIFDCFAARVVPVYWGASNVTEYIPAECFIDRRKFKDEKELYEFLEKMKKEEYETYLTAAAKFVTSEKAKLFSEENFIQIFLQASSFDTVP